MRYVIVIAAVTFFVLWEVIYDDWRLTNAVIAEVMRVLAAIGLG